MKVALIGASGMAGSRILNELLLRGHDVCAIVRHPDKITAQPRLQVVKADINNTSTLVPVLKGQDAVISAVHFTDTNIEHLIDALKQVGVKRYLIVGGAGGLNTADGKKLVESENFPEHVKPEALAGIKILERLKQEKDLDWTFLSPSLLFRPGEKTGEFRLGKDDLLLKDGQSAISAEDYAIALVNELEQPQHIQQRFTVGY